MVNQRRAFVNGIRYRLNQCPLCWKLQVQCCRNNPSLRNDQQTSQVPDSLRVVTSPVVDGENNAVSFDVAYAVKGDTLSQTIESIKRLHGDNVYLLPISGASGGGGIFQFPAPSMGTVVGLQIVPTNQPRIRLGTVTDIVTLSLDEIVIDTAQHRIYAGAGITLDQLNQALGDQLGAQHKVLGADLTSYTYAQVGATFMTGGMGPQRRYFSDSVTEIALHTGSRIESIVGEALNAYAGTYGWTGIVTAVCCRYSILPKNETAFAIPISNTVDHLSRLLSCLSRWTYLKLDNNNLVTINQETDLITGIEHVTAVSMEPMFDRDGDNPITRRAEALKQKCLAIGADGLLFVNGYSSRPTDEFLLQLVDDTAEDELTIGGINLEYTEVFNDPEQMRALREAIPFAARTQVPAGRYVFKGHTDATVRLHPDWVESAMSSLWKANQDYVTNIEQFFSEHKSVRGQILVYGHLNPYGVDPHNRVTMACDDETVFQQTVAFLHTQRQHFYQAMRHLCDDTGSIFVGGEKGAGSEQEILPALGNLKNLPGSLAKKFERQSELVRATPAIYSWRALAPYRNPQA
ncbi:MAG: hypothetical protein ACR2QW_06525 [bacterium]